MGWKSHVLWFFLRALFRGTVGLGFCQSTIWSTMKREKTTRSVKALLIKKLKRNSIMCRYQEKSPHLRNWGDYGPQLKKPFYQVAYNHQIAFLGIHTLVHFSWTLCRSDYDDIGVCGWRSNFTCVSYWLWTS